MFLFRIFVLVVFFRHNNHTGRWLTNFRAVWHPQREDCFVVGSMDRPRRVKTPYAATASMYMPFDWTSLIYFSRLNCSAQMVTSSRSFSVTSFWTQYAVWMHFIPRKTFWLVEIRAGGFMHLCEHFIRIRSVTHNWSFGPLFICIIFYLYNHIRRVHNI